MNFDLDNFEKIIGCLKIVHHVDGRIRFKLDSTFLNKISISELGDVEQFGKYINGILGISLNKIVKSVTIEYDPNIIEPSFWEGLISKNKECFEKLKKLLRR